MLCVIYLFTLVVFHTSHIVYFINYSANKGGDTSLRVKNKFEYWEVKPTESVLYILQLFVSVFFQMSYRYHNSGCYASVKIWWSGKLYDTGEYILYSKCYKFSNTFLFLFLSKILVIRAGIDKMLVRIANREEPDQTACSEAVIWFCTVCLGSFGIN